MRHLRSSLHMLRGIVPLCATLLCALQAHTAEDPVFKSELFKTGKLIYSDDFDGEYDKERWGAQKKDRQIKDGKLIVTARFKSKEEAMKALKRDHHLGLEPVVHLNKIPEAFVCDMRYKFETDKITTGRPVLQIGHHMILFNHLEGGGHRIKLPDGPSFTETKSGLKVGEWIEMVIEYRKGELTVGVKGYSKTYKHEAVSIINEKDKLGPRFTFKGGPDCRIIFDSIRLWKCEE
ncbi:MAG: hypothetical protein VXZ82_19065 [Planctomycetota bacterium]|nr:hypothetical protein [Planctomycetota bacterium]